MLKTRGPNRDFERSGFDLLSILEFAPLVPIVLFADAEVHYNYSVE